MHRPSPARHLAPAPRAAVALLVGVALALGALGCEDGANSKIGAGGTIDTGVVDPNKGDNRPPMDAGVPDDGVADAGAPDGPPTGRLDRGNDGDHLDGGVDGAVDGGEGTPDAAIDRPCVAGATRPCDACGDAFETCEAGAWGPCEAPAEVCNGSDDDCDGRVDELFPVGEACTAGLGLCAAEGTTVCDGPGAVRCDAMPGAPEQEGCNTLDDDCDGTIDEDFGGGQPCVLGVGRCAVPSVTACLGEATFCLGEAEAPIDERCNGIDDDCDGVADEDFDLGADCEIGQGLCRARGVRVCADDGGGLCAADVIAPRDELCDGLDDDCDGTVDEGFGDVGPCFEGVGACRREGRVVCDAAGRFRCSAGPGDPADELCNGVDDDCDGATDERLGVGAACAVGVGGCARAGVTICAADGSVRCPAEEGAPSDELCNGIDDDCDGGVDEDYRVGERCAVGVGACSAGGELACDGAGGVACDAPVIAPVDETCDGADDDCDGAVDEGFGVGDRCVGGAGACAREGRVACVADGTAACGAEEGQPAFEACNGVDDDCDGAADEGLGLGSPCVEGIGACARAGVRACDADGEAACDAAPGPPADEICDGIDDDCDGMTDEGIALDGAPLGGACAVGVGVCRAAGRVVCGDDGRARCDAAPGAPGVERCDGLDDDCDGRADEGFDLGAACSEGVGACVRAGQRICRGGVGACSAAAGDPAAELCNAVDDDCDGQVDEGLTLDGAALGARCELGLGQCLAGGVVVCDGVAPVCDARPGDPRPESCNGLDDDCDGEVDDGLGLGDRCERGVGACVRAGLLICDDDGGTACTARAGDPRDERCDATDDDCDGAVDEDFDLGAACTSGIGACAVAGVTVCAPAGDRARCGAVPGAPVAERCNDIDDDCDGRVDEGLALDGVPYGDPCSAGLGACLVGGVVVCAADGGLECDARPGMPAPSEACDAIDDDCDGRVDEGYGIGDDCISGLGICAEEGSRVCADDGTGACDAEPGRPEVERCDDLDNDCDGIVDEGEGDQAGVAFGLCGPRYRSCLDALRAGGVESGVYRVSSADAAGREVYCDQETDGGGWTLVLASNAPPVDGLGAWHDELLDTHPERSNSGVWAGLSHLGERPFDLRFACRARDVVVGDDGSYDVDVSFYGTPWYRQFLRGGEAVSCFATGAGDPVLPARRDNIGGGVRAHGQPYPSATGGRLVGERACDSPDFSIDFDDGALAGARLDGTDWGSRGGRGICGVDSPRGQWLVFAREDVPHPLGPVGLIGLPQLDGPLEAAGFEPIALDVDDPDLGARLDPEVLPAVFIGRYAEDWDAVPASLRNDLGCYTLDGGSLVTEFDGFALLGTRYADDFAYAEDAPDPWAWLPAVSGGGSTRAIDTPVFISDRLDPITRGLGEQLLAGDGTERFLTIGRVHPTVPTLLATLARFPGDGDRFPEASYPALLRGNQCGGSLLVGTFDYADAPRDPGVARLVGNLGAAAVSPPDTTLDDICRRGLGAGRCIRVAP